MPPRSARQLITSVRIHQSMATEIPCFYVMEFNQTQSLTQHTHKQTENRFVVGDFVCEKKVQCKSVMGTSEEISSI